MINHSRNLALYVSTLFIAGCASFLVPHDDQWSETLSSHNQVIALDVNVCRKNLNKIFEPAVSELDSTNIEVLSWNIKKGQLAEWRNDLQELADGKDLIIIQEAVLSSDLIELFKERMHWSFSTGFKTNKRVTGVMTFSNSEPLTQCNLSNVEPWLGTPKATNITEYGLSSSDETLVVVNIHAINFTFGVNQFQEQIDQIYEVLADHEGPIILSGDFNTWRKKRMEILESLVVKLDLEALSLNEDHRKSVFGHRLDHIYIRELIAKNSTSHLVKSSDHNPITATFSL